MAAVPVLGTIDNPGPQNPETKAKTNLIVNYLPQTLTEDDLKTLFSAFGVVISAKLIKDKSSGVSLGYGFVNYGTADEAELAIEKMNGANLESKTLKVSYARPSSVSIKNANVYIANLPPQLSNTELDTIFEPFGTIITSKILSNQETGLGKGVGFVRFDKYTQAEMAIAALNGKTIPGSPNALVVKFANPPKAVPPGGASSPTSTGSPITTQIQKRSATTQPYTNGGGGGASGSGVGPMRHTPSMANMRYNPVSTLAAAGMVTNPVAMAAALSGIPGMAANITTPTAMTTTSDGSYCIFVYNLPESAQDFLLYQLFSPFGAITSVNVIKDLKTGISKRYGFVNMKNYDEALAAIMGLNGYVHDGKALQVSFKNQKK